MGLWKLLKPKTAWARAAAEELDFLVMLRRRPKSSHSLLTLAICARGEDEEQAVSLFPIAAKRDVSDSTAQYRISDEGVLRRGSPLSLKRNTKRNSAGLFELGKRLQVPMDN